MEFGGAAEGGPTLDPDVEAVRAHEGQLATCAADGESHVAGGGTALRRQRLEELIQAHQHPQQQYPHDQVMHMQMKEQEQEEPKVVPVDEQADVPDRGRRLQKHGGSAAIPGSMTTTSAPTIMRVKAKARVEGFEMPDESDGYGCVFLFYFYFLRLFVWMVHVLMSWLGAQGS